MESGLAVGVRGTGHCEPMTRMNDLSRETQVIEEPDTGATSAATELGMDMPASPSGDTLADDGLTHDKPW
jgi:hypothetical protein